MFLHQRLPNPTRGTSTVCDPLTSWQSSVLLRVEVGFPKPPCRNLKSVVSCLDLDRILNGLNIAEYMHRAVLGIKDEQCEKRSVHSSSALRWCLSKRRCDRLSVVGGSVVGGFVVRQILRGATRAPKLHSAYHIKWIPVPGTKFIGQSCVTSWCPLKCYGATCCNTKCYGIGRRVTSYFTTSRFRGILLPRVILHLISHS